MRKSVTVCYELMFTRPLFQTADIEAQHRLLNEVAELVDSDLVRSTMRENYGRIDAANLMRAMAFLKSGRAIGKIVLAGFLNNEALRPPRQTQQISERRSPVFLRPRR